jgi:molecular chaperone GrpE
MTADPKQNPHTADRHGSGEPADRTVGPSESDAVENEAAQVNRQGVNRQDVTHEDLAAEAGASPDPETLEALELNEAEGGEDTAPHHVAELEAKLAETKNELLRALAETENVRNRARREKDEALKYAAAPLAKDLLSVADNLKRALAAVPPEAREQNEALAQLLTGVEMTDKALDEAFAKHGISPIDPTGQKLDPHRHEAMLEVEDPSQPSGTVAQVFELGYVLRDRLLRPARVSVTKGGPKAGEEPPKPGSKVDTEA